VFSSLLLGCSRLGKEVYKKLFLNFALPRNTFLFPKDLTLFGLSAPWHGRYPLKLTSPLVQSVFCFFLNINKNVESYWVPQIFFLPHLIHVTSYVTLYSCVRSVAVILMLFYLFEKKEKTKILNSWISCLKLRSPIRITT